MKFRVQYNSSSSILLILRKNDRWYYLDWWMEGWVSADDTIGCEITREYCPHILCEFECDDFQEARKRAAVYIRMSK